MEAYWCHAVQKLGTNYLFRKTDNCSGRLIGVPEDL